ncbi:MutS family DNA mismatch repair protein [Massilibacteroides sp.]|uniref:MutS family DNA mismatch repair protein n=1 Tax=Massilibacteroides sp. TaxID=2034766 RepID=UPI00261BEBD4|nr:MutS family DNA mismatch repair protein [Massilibacteroides sp.]MDD4516159.1 DNA mismatch repair protein MutS [Massilibacteroides sp.]
MEKIYQFYNEKHNACKREVAQLSRRIHLYGTIRLILFIGLFITLYIFSNSDWQVWALITTLFTIPFVLLMVYHTHLYNQRKWKETLLLLCENELKGLDYDFNAFDGSTDKVNSGHSFSIDLDLFGDRSFFQSINRTSTYIGNERLAEWLLEPLNDKQKIIERQQAIQELSSLTSFRQNFYVEGSLKPGKKEDYKRLSELTDTLSYFSDSLLWKILLWAFPIVWTALIIAVIIGLIDVSILSFAIVLSMVIAYSQAKKTTLLHNQVNKLENLFVTYSSLIHLIEDTPFKSALLNCQKERFGTETKASLAIRRLSRAIGALDQRLSAAGLILQIFTLRDVRTSIRIERWMQVYKDKMPLWFDALATVDALNSMGGFGFNHPGYIYPEIADNYFKMEGKQLGHPLMNREKCVKNDISIKETPSFLIITGANMAGKSTYLRTVGLNHVLACCGMPVCAESLTIYPAKLVTSLRTSDDLMSNESYFFAELKRLKMIIDRLQSGEKLFIILDEILKGTNSVDKQKGSLALMKQLVKLDSCGIIATHDLVLGTLADEFPKQISNFRFEADITNNELTFSYLLRPGIAQNMNACFLMQKMGITI